MLDAILFSLERKRLEWREVLDTCPCCGERHWWGLNPTRRLVDCVPTDSLHSLDELPADVAARVAFRIAGLVKGAA